jgi:hypothetical protein
MGHAFLDVEVGSASSGKTSNRHRLNRGGDRLANCALWRIVMTRLICHEPTRSYMTRRTAEGMSSERSSDALSAMSLVRCIAHSPQQSCPSRANQKLRFRLVSPHVESCQRCDGPTALATFFGLILFSLKGWIKLARTAPPERRSRAAIRPGQATAFLMSSLILASVAASSEVMFHTTGCMWTPSSRAGFSASPKPNAMKSLPGLM